MRPGPTRPRFRRAWRDTTPPTPTQTNSQIDPLYIPVPLYSSSGGAVRPVFDGHHLHRPPGHHRPLAARLGPRCAGVVARQRAAARPRPPPDHPQRRPARVVERHRHPGDLARRAWPRWRRPRTTPRSRRWRTSPAAASASTGVGEVPTNAYLWFQTLPGAGPPTPGPVQTNCVIDLASGTVVGGAALDDGTGYYEVDAAGRRGGLRRRHLLRRPDRRAPQPAHRRHGRRPGHRWLLAGGVRRRCVRLQRARSWARQAAST